MLFAVMDYLKYKHRTGIYSDEYLNKIGGRLAVPDNFHGVESFGPRYLFFCHTRYSVVSWLIMYYTSSPWSHVGSFSENGRVIDTTTRGMIEHPFSDYLDGRSFIGILAVKESVASEEQLRGVLWWNRGHLGCKFNWIGIVRLFFYITLGAHASYCTKFSADFLIIALFLVPLSLLNPIFGILIGLASGIYTLTVVANTSRRRAMRRSIRKRAETEEEKMIEALWTVEFLSGEGYEGAGVAIFESSRIFGGDVSYYYLGNYEIKNDQITAKIKVKHHGGRPLSIFGELEEFTLQLSGKVELPVMTASGYLLENKNQKIVVRCTKRADLP